ncbi:MAG: hypothetical protein DI622_17815 [Chryseobacterium sp.]|nr:MAG: hypothetical protein DI622_17815 [Chryseobacterium sp.]
MNKYSQKDIRMNNESFKERLLPEMKFFADMPTEHYNGIDDILEIRKIRWPEPPGELLKQVTFTDQALSATDGRSIITRLYRPVKDQEIKNIVVWCHGGGFFSGNLDTEHINCLNIAAGSNSIVYSPDYRLAPEFPYPNGLEDCYTVLNHAISYAEKHGIPSVIVGGTSSGATLAAALTLLARDRGLKGITKQILLVPPILPNAVNASMEEFEELNGGWDAVNARLIWKYYLGEQITDNNGYMAPGLAQDLSDLPPAYVVTAELDPLRDEGEWYASRLLKSDIKVIHKNYKGITHYFLAAAGSEFFKAFTEDLLTAINSPNIWLD